MALFDFLFGSQSKTKKLPTMIPEQLQLLKDFISNPLSGNPLYQQGSQFLQNLYGGQLDKSFEAPYLQNFQENIAPQIAERFGAAGTGAGALNSSAFANSLAQAGRSLQTDLAGLRSQRQLQGLPALLQQATAPGQYALQGLNYQPFAYAQQPGTQGLLPPILSGLAGGIGGGFGLGLGNQIANSYFNPYQSGGYAGYAPQPGAYGY